MGKVWQIFILFLPLDLWENSWTTWRDKSWSMESWFHIPSWWEKCAFLKWGFQDSGDDTNFRKHNQPPFVTAIIYSFISNSNHTVSFTIRESLALEILVFDVDANPLISYFANVLRQQQRRKRPLPKSPSLRFRNFAQTIVGSQRQRLYHQN